MKKRIATIIGARPQFVKAAVLSRVFQQCPDIEEILIHTGQHFDANMSAIFFEELGISQPKYQLDIHGGSHGKMTGEMLIALEKILMSETPDMVLVYGDTNSTLAGALAASKLHIPISHVEAGLRSFNKKMPEEINRILADHMSNLLFCPTQTTLLNLKNEGITKGVYHVGDIMYDATLMAKEYIEKNVNLFEKKFETLKGDFALMTVHRQESTDCSEAFSERMQYAKAFLQKHNNLKIFFPIHPRIKKLVEPFRADSTFIFSDPLSYFETHYLLSRASYVLTDSGGLQKEAYFHHVPCLTLRDQTEWIETIECGWNRLWKDQNFNPRKTIDDYGSGQTATAILEILKYA